MPVIIPSGVTPLDIVGQYVNPTAPTSGILYTSVGERWDSVAFKMYGDASQISDLILYNPGVLVSDIIPAGTQVFVPLITPVATPPSSTPWS